MKIFGYNITKKKDIELKSISFNTQFQGLFSNNKNIGVEIYSKLWVATKCVDIISENVANLPFYVQDNKENKIEEQQFYNFLNNPNNTSDTGQDIIQSVVAYLLLTGNGYIYKNAGLKTDYYALLSQNVNYKIEKNVLFGDILYYDYEEKGIRKRILPDEMISVKSYNPKSRYTGLPKLTGASQEVDFLELSNIYKNSLYKNQATPSGAFETNDVLSKEQFERLKKQLIRDYTGAKNAGTPMLFEAGLQYKQYAFNPTDLDLIKSEQTTIGSIATAYGVPVEMLGGLSDKKNYSNYKEARASFYIETVLPLAGKILTMLSQEFYPNNEYKIKINKTEIPELKPTADDLAKTWWISPNMKRALQGYEKSEDESMNKIYIPANYMEINDLNDIDIKDEL